MEGMTPDDSMQTNIRYIQKELHDLEILHKIFKCGALLALPEQFIMLELPRPSPGDAVYMLHKPSFEY